MIKLSNRLISMRQKVTDNFPINQKSPGQETKASLIDFDQEDDMLENLYHDV